jgi:hypothetical protein
MKAIMIFASLVLLTHAAWAQTHSQRVMQTGIVTRGHPLMWDQNGKARDAGPALAGSLNNIGITPLSTNPNAPFCINDTFVSNSSGYHEFCVAPNAFGGGGEISYAAYGGAQPVPFRFQTDAALSFLSATGSVQVINLPQTVPGDVPVCINSGTGQLYQAAATDQYIPLTDDTSTHYLTDESGTYFLAAFIPAGSCKQQ